MKTLALAAVAATMAASTAFAHPVNEPHVCGVDPDTVMEYPGYAGKQGVWYDRGDYFFGFETVRFLEPVEYKSWSKVEGITTHHRLYKDDCRSSEIEIVHTEGKDNVEVESAGSGSSDNASLIVSFAINAAGEIVATYGDSSINFGVPNPANEQSPSDLVETGNTGSQNGSTVTIFNLDTNLAAGSIDFSNQDQAWDDLGEMVENLGVDSTEEGNEGVLNPEVKQAS